MFLKNAWYVAANDHEIGRHLHATRILGEDIVLYRTLDGGVSAPEDACPHRKLPLSMGRLLDDTVECGYHGLVFDCSRSEEHTSELQSLMRISYAVFCLKKKQ